MYTKSHEDRKIQRECAACDAAIRWGAEAEVSIEEVLLAAERMLADAERRLAREYELGPGSRTHLSGSAGYLSREVEALRLRLEDDLADLARIHRERERYDRKRAEDHAADLGEHLLDLGVAMQQGQREEGR